MQDITTKHLNRTIRVLRLLAVVQAYHHYSMMQLNRELLQIDNNWQDAEKMSNLMAILIPYKEYSPTDFLYSTNEVTDTILDNYDKFKHWIEIAESVGISEKTLTAFCKSVDNLQCTFHLKVLGHIFYPLWLSALFLYLNNAISKTQLQKSFVEYTFFTGTSKPANFFEFRKTVLNIERIIFQINEKQMFRSIKKSSIK